MKYYIVGKKIREGTLQDDTPGGKLAEYFELGWEYVGTHFHIKHLHSNKMLQPDDVIVTLRDRMFMYQGFWPNVMAYEDFVNMEKNGSIVDVCGDVDSRASYYLNCSLSYMQSPKVVELIKNIYYKDVSHFNTTDPYCCLHIRYRGWAQHRNNPAEFWHKIIDAIKQTGLNIYIFGKEAASFTDGVKIFHVNLDEYASLLHNPNCKFLIGGMSGGTLVAQTFAHPKCIQYVLIGDNQTWQEFTTYNEYRIFYHNEETNICKAPIRYVTLTNDSHLSEAQLLNEISK